MIQARVVVGLIGLLGVVSCVAMMRHQEIEPLKSADVRVIDGDTFELGTERVRLNGIDTPEAPGHCRPGRKCVDGDWDLARFNLTYALSFGELQVERIKMDRYGRTVAQVTAGTLDASCYMLRTGNAVYKPKWDEGGRTKRACPELAK